MAARHATFDIYVEVVAGQEADSSMSVSMRMIRIARIIAKQWESPSIAFSAKQQYEGKDAIVMLFQIEFEKSGKGPHSRICFEYFGLLIGY